MHVDTVINKNGKENDTLVNGEIKIFQLLSVTDENEIFNNEAIADYIDYKWGTFGFNTHLIGFLFHLVQITMLCIYIQWIYIEDSLYEFKMQDGVEIRVRKSD